MLQKSANRFYKYPADLKSLYTSFLWARRFRRTCSCAVTCLLHAPSLTRCNTAFFLVTQTLLRNKGGNTAVWVSLSLAFSLSLPELSHFILSKFRVIFYVLYIWLGEGMISRVDTQSKEEQHCRSRTGQRHVHVLMNNWSGIGMQTELLCGTRKWKRIKSGGAERFPPLMTSGLFVFFLSSAHGTEEIVVWWFVCVWWGRNSCQRQGWTISHSRTLLAPSQLVSCLSCSCRGSTRLQKTPKHSSMMNHFYNQSHCFKQVWLSLQKIETNKE